MLDTRELRRTLGCFATGVVVVTSNDGARVHGMTANSFMSVSLEPPLVLISVASRAKMAAVLNREPHYGLSILSCPQEPISAHFAKRGSRRELEFEWHEGVPLIAGALGHLVCRIVERIVLGDHTLFVGEVVHHCRREGPPLLYFAGGYQRLRFEEASR
jgi:flavin reductase (DIM6/NTAB) family NADH-FMN oxidoreductase RutF